ncbi:MAG: hypothetical protein L6V87_11205 [Ruminococcus sp.]|nr:MAG: hypothetical protein L6V87_11205 [Ruminococcus sp.]
MKNFKRYAAGLAAVMMASSFAACGSSSGTAEDTTTSATTTTGVTVEINTETLASEEQVTMDDVTKLLPDVELENKNIKWFSFYDPFHATTSGNTKALSLELFEKKYGGTIEYIPTTWSQRFYRPFHKHSGRYRHRLYRRRRP